MTHPPFGLTKRRTQVTYTSIYDIGWTQLTSADSPLVLLDDLGVSLRTRLTTPPF